MPMRPSRVLVRPAPRGFIALALALLLAAPAARSEEKSTLALPLRLQPKPGEAFHRLQTQSMTFTQPGIGPDGGDVVGAQSFATRPVYRAEETLADGSTAMSLVIEAMKVESTSPTGETAAFDSEDAASFAAAEANPLLATFRPMAGSTLHLVVGRNGSVSSVKGMEAIADKFVANIPPGEECDSARDSFLKQLGEAGMISSQEAVLKFAPNREVSPGDSWDVVNTFSSGFPMIIRSSATLREFADGRAIVDMESVVEPNPDAPAVDQGGAMLRYELFGAMTGTVVLLEESGFPESFDFELTAKGHLVAEVPGRDEPIRVPLEIEMKNAWRPSEAKQGSQADARRMR